MSQSVQVWQVPLAVSEETLRAYEGCLSVDERSRADRFHFPDDRRRYIVARGTLRHLLGRRLEHAPKEIEFCYGEYGKPSIVSDRVAAGDAGNCNFHFNVSHSGELALCALSGHRRVGVDIEKLKSIQRLDSMMERCLSQYELSQVKNEPDQAHAFLQRWTCKEAYLKAIGLGLSQSMQAVEVEISPLKLIRLPQDCASGWQLHPIKNVPESYVGALVTEGEAAVTFSTWQHVG